MSLLHALGALLAAATGAYLALAMWCVLRFRGGASAADDGPGDHRAVSVLVPVHGAPPGLAACLHSICRQDLPRMQVVFGLHRADDPGRAVIEQVLAVHPDLDAEVVVDSRRAGTNPKVCNLLNMYPAARHDVIAMIDSDVMLPGGTLHAMLAPLADPRVGAATCAYAGVSAACVVAAAAPRGRLASAVGALFMNDWLLPSALVDVRVNRHEPCFGAAVMATRAALERAGGLAATADAVAQDDALGAALHDAGYRVHLAPVVVTTVVAESGAGALWRHELRWMRTVRACRPRDHALAGVMYTVPALVFLLPGAGPVQLALAAVLLALRIALHAAVRVRFHTVTPAGAWLVPVRECFGFAVWVASFASRRMHWGEQVLHASGRRATRAGPDGGE